MTPGAINRGLVVANPASAVVQNSMPVASPVSFVSTAGYSKEELRDLVSSLGMQIANLTAAAQAMEQQRDAALNEATRLQGEVNTVRGEYAALSQQLSAEKDSRHAAEIKAEVAEAVANLRREIDGGSTTTKKHTPSDLAEAINFLDAEVESFAELFPSARQAEKNRFLADMRKHVGAMKRAFYASFMYFTP